MKSLKFSAALFAIIILMMQFQIVLADTLQLDPTLINKIDAIKSADSVQIQPTYPLKPIQPITDQTQEDKTNKDTEIDPAAYIQSLPNIEREAIEAAIKEGIMPPLGIMNSLPTAVQKYIAELVNLAAKDKKNEDTVPATTSSDALSQVQSAISEYWVQFLALIVSVVGVVLAISGFSMANSKKKKSMSKLMNEIDDTFAAFKWKSKRCEAELYRLHDIVDDKLKQGKIDESTYQLLMGRIDKYLTEIKELDAMPKKAEQ